MRIKWRRLKEILIEKKLITQSDLADALRIQKATKESLGRILVEKDLITEKQLLETLSEQTHLPIANIKDKTIDWELVDIFSQTLIVEHRCFPIEKTVDTIFIAVDDPMDAWIVVQAEKDSQSHRIRRVLVSRQDIDEVLEKYRQHRKEKIKKLFNI